MPTPTATPAGHLLLVDDDPAFCHVMQRAFSRRGFKVTLFNQCEPVLNGFNPSGITHVLLDLKLAQESGLTLIPYLLNLKPQLPIIVLTGFASISTAVEAIKRGAQNYLLKPISVDDILQAFAAICAPAPPSSPAQAPSLHRREWEHIQNTLLAHNGNVSAAARALGVHRRTLQRKLLKRPSAQAFE